MWARWELICLLTQVVLTLEHGGSSSVTCSWCHKEVDNVCKRMCFDMADNENGNNGLLNCSSNKTNTQFKSNTEGTFWIVLGAHSQGQLPEWNCTRLDLNYTKPAQPNVYYCTFPDPTSIQTTTPPITSPTTETSSPTSPSTTASASATPTTLSLTSSTNTPTTSLSTPTISTSTTSLTTSAPPSASSPEQGITLVVEMNLTNFTRMELYVSATKISFNISEVINPILQVTLPADLFSRVLLKHDRRQDKINFTFSVFKNTPADQTAIGRLGQIRFGIEVENITISNLSTPFNMTFKHTSKLQEDNNTTCVFLNQSRGEWVTDGCQTLTLTHQTICSCDHFSFFALMIPDVNLSGDHAYSLRVLSYVGAAISAFFCTITLLTHCLEHARKSTDHAMLIHLQLVASLLLSNLLLLSSVGLASVGPASVAPGLCLTLAALLHYSLLCCFTWMGLEALHLYRLLVLVYNTYMRRYLLKLSLLGWGVPALVVSIVIAVDRDFYGLHNEMCWIRVSVVQYGSVVAYMIVILLFNGTIFIIVVTTTMHQLRLVPSSQKRRQSCKITCSILGLTCALGLTWGLGFFSMGYTNLVVLYVFTILNSLQGFFLFLWICVKRLRGTEQGAMATGQTLSTQVLSAGSEAQPSSERLKGQ